MKLYNEDELALMLKDANNTTIASNESLAGAKTFLAVVEGLQKAAQEYVSCAEDTKAILQAKINAYLNQQAANSSWENL